MNEDADIVEDIFSRIKEILGNDFNGDIAVRLENEESAIRREWGGQKSYVQKIRKNQRQMIKNAAINDVNNGITVNEVIRKRGISRTEMYRLLKVK